MYKRQRQEHDYLNRQQAALTPVIKQISKAISDMDKERLDLMAAIIEIEATLKAAGFEANSQGVSELGLQQAEYEARKALAQKMLGDSATLSDIAFVTGLSLEEITVLAPKKTAMLNDTEAKAILTAAVV